MEIHSILGELLSKNRTSGVALIPIQVGLPFLRAKAQDYYEDLGGGLDTEVIQESMDVRQVQRMTDGVSCF